MPTLLREKHARKRASLSAWLSPLPEARGGRGYSLSTAHPPILVHSAAKGDTWALGMSRALPGLCSAIGVVARGTDLRSNGFSDGSSVYCCRALSRPGIDTVRPKASGEVNLPGRHDR